MPAVLTELEVIITDASGNNGNDPPAAGWTSLTKTMKEWNRPDEAGIGTRAFR